MKQLLFLAAISIFLLSCSNKKIIREVNISQPWDSAQFYSLNIPINDTSVLYSVVLKIKKEKNYNYQNLWLFMNVVSPGGKSRNDTIDFVFDQVNANRKTFKYLLADSLKFNETGIYEFNFKQALRIKSLNNIIKIGLTIEKK